MSLPAPGVQALSNSKLLSVNNVFSRWAKKCTWLMLLLVVCLITTQILVCLSHAQITWPTISFG